MIPAIILGLISGAFTLMIHHWMQYGHILGFIPYMIAEPSHEKEFIAQMKDFGERSQAMQEYYWKISGDNLLLRIMICEVCLSVYVFFGMFLAFGTMDFLSFFAGLSSTYLLIRYVP